MENGVLLLFNKTVAHLMSSFYVLKRRRWFLKCQNNKQTFKLSAKPVLTNHLPFRRRFEVLAVIVPLITITVINSKIVIIWVQRNMEITE